MRNKAHSNRFRRRIDFPSDINGIASDLACAAGAQGRSPENLIAHTVSPASSVTHMRHSGLFQNLRPDLSQYFACCHDRLAARFL